MGMYRKKPVVIEAVRFDGVQWDYGISTVNYGADDVPDFVLKATEDGILFPDNETQGNHLLINTLEGEMTASVGDYIICGVQGEIYPCKPDIFEQTYEEVTDES